MQAMCCIPEVGSQCNALVGLRRAVRSVWRWIGCRQWITMCRRAARTHRRCFWRLGLRRSLRHRSGGLEIEERMRRAHWHGRVLWKVRIVLSLLLARRLNLGRLSLSRLLYIRGLLRSVKRLSGITGRQLCVLLLIQVLENAQKRYWHSRVARHLVLVPDHISRYDDLLSARISQFPAAVVLWIAQEHARHGV
jgi:hypothetical protein